MRAVDLDLARLANVADHPCLERVTGDLTDPGLLPRLVAGVEVVYHLASAHLDATLPDSHYHRVNVEATLALGRAACQAGVRRFVHCSSNGVVGRLTKPPADETTPCRPTNIYETTKLLGEQSLLALAEETGLPVVVIRPAWVYGLRCPRTARLLRAVHRGRFVMFGHGRTLRHPIFVGDAVRGLELAADARGAAGQVYFIAGEMPVTLNELVRTIAAVQGVRPPWLRLPLPLGMAAAYALEAAFRPFGRRPPLSRRSLDFFVKDNAYDISKARRELGFSPQVDLRAGLEQIWTAS